MSDFNWSAAVLTFLNASEVPEDILSVESFTDLEIWAGITFNPEKIGVKPSCISLANCLAIAEGNDLENVSIVDCISAIVILGSTEPLPSAALLDALFPEPSANLGAVFQLR